jgi:hypothetical protein
MRIVDRPDYNEYLNSENWAARRRERLELDQYRCRKCDGTLRLRVHHRTYRNLGAEPMDDLVTLCEDCHQAIHGLCLAEGRSRSDERVLARVTAKYLGEPVLPAQPPARPGAAKGLTPYKQAQKAIQKLRAPNGKRYFLQRVDKGSQPARYRLAYRAAGGKTIADLRSPLTAEEIISGGLDTYGRLSAKRSVAPAERSPATGGAVSVRQSIPKGKPRVVPVQDMQAGAGFPEIPGWTIESLGQTPSGDPIVILHRVKSSPVIPCRPPLSPVVFQ